MAYVEAYAEESSPKNRVQSAKTKRPGFLTRWFLKKLVEGVEQEKRQYQDRDIVSMKQTGLAISGRGEPSIDQPDRAIQFTVYTANGGRVVETRRYDRQKDRHSNGLYVITSDQDFGKEIDKIITMESLKS